MKISVLEKNKAFRLVVLVKLYEVSDGQRSYAFRDLETVEKLFSNREEGQEDRILSALQFWYEEKYLTYIDASCQSGPDMLQIQLTSKGIRLAEAILSHEDVSKIEPAFTPQIVNIFYSNFHNLENSPVIIGDSNMQSS